MGAVTGALIGSAIGGGTGERIGGAIAGAAIGGLIGNRIGASMDEEDRRMAYEAEMAALEQGRVGAPVGWRNPGSGRYGNIVPGPVYVQRGSRCRSYTHTVYISGRPEVVRGTACRNPDGTWTAPTAQLNPQRHLNAGPVMTAGGAFRATAWILAVVHGATGTIAACQVATR